MAGDDSERTKLGIGDVENQPMLAHQAAAFGADAAVALALGIMNLGRALGVVALPPPPTLE